MSTQMNIKQGLEKLREKVNAAILEELGQSNNKEELMPMIKEEMPHED